MNAAQAGLDVGDRLPDLRLDGRDGSSVSVRAGPRLGSVLVTVHDECDACAMFVDRLVERSADIREWDGRVLVVGGASDRAGGDIVRFAVDTGGRLERTGVATPAVLVADQWGELFAVQQVGDAHAFMPPDEIVEWLRYLSVSCPECEGEAL